MSELITWLRQTIEGDKVAAEALDGEVWTAVKAQGDWHIQTSQDQTFGGDARWGELDPREAVLIAAHDPRDTIARCEAELALLDEHAVEDTGFGKYCRVCSEYSTKPGESSELEPAAAPCRTVLLLATSRRHRLGFNPEWVSG